MCDIHLCHPGIYTQWYSYLNEYFGGLAAKVIVMHWNMDDPALSQQYLKAYNESTHGIPVYLSYSILFSAADVLSSLGPTFLISE